MPSEFILPIRVYVDDTDAGKIVYHANYLKYCEHARTEWLRELGVAKPAVLSAEKLLVVAEANVRYLRPAKLDDLLFVSVAVSRVARTYIVFLQEVNCERGIVCKAEIKIACVMREHMKPAAFPTEFKQLLDAHVCVD